MKYLCITSQGDKFNGVDKMFISFIGLKGGGAIYNTIALFI